MSARDDSDEELQRSTPGSSGPERAAGGMGVSSERVGHAGPGQGVAQTLNESLLAGIVEFQLPTVGLAKGPHQSRFHLLPIAGELILVRQLGADCHLVFRAAAADRLDGHIALHRFADLLDRGIRGELDRHEGAAGECRGEDPADGGSAQSHRAEIDTEHDREKPVRQRANGAGGEKKPAVPAQR